ncbi:hypothetical protein [Coralloluteibacterium thermophilus]|uniref:Uncharacterized protein n=1 Tax=Coralloluteibacterium thermophilum TaxID=2707049 RepID=A0ABV9NHB0_9GAMM
MNAAAAGRARRLGACAVYALVFVALGLALQVIQNALGLALPVLADTALACLVVVPAALLLAFRVARPRPLDPVATHVVVAVLVYALIIAILGAAGGPASGGWLLWTQPEAWGRLFAALGQGGAMLAVSHLAPVLAALGWLHVLGARRGRSPDADDDGPPDRG